jgi:plasmid stability protein
MATLTISDLPEDVHQQLRARAAASGRSVAAEAREILVEGCNGRRARTPEEREAAMRRLQAFAEKLRGGDKTTSMVDEFIAERRREAERETCE